MDKSLYTLDFMRHTYENFPIGVFVYGERFTGEDRFADRKIVAVHNDAIGIYERLAQDAAFMALDKFAKADKLKEAARAARPTATIRPLVPNVVELANAQ